MSVAAFGLPAAIAQEPAIPAAQVPPPPSVTVEGCLVREQDVPGRKPNAVERQGILEDYILTDTKMIKGAAPSGLAGQAKPGETPIGTSGTAPMYDVKGIKADELKALVGQRVQIDGTFADVVRDPDAKIGEDLADLRGGTIRKVAGDCPPPR
jgi:hypothetical protein